MSTKLAITASEEIVRLILTESDIVIYAGQEAIARKVDDAILRSNRALIRKIKRKMKAGLTVYQTFGSVLPEDKMFDIFDELAKAIGIAANK